MHSFGKTDTPTLQAGSSTQKECDQIRSGMICRLGGLAGGLPVEIELKVLAMTTGVPGALDTSAEKVFSGSVRAMDPAA
jgi:hypothetical protein